MILSPLRNVALFLGIFVLVMTMLYATGVGHSSDYDHTYAGRSTVFVATPEGVGSGVYIGEGYIITATHVVTDADGTMADSISIRTQLGAIREATVMFVNDDLDIALLRVTEEINMDASELACDEGLYMGHVDLQGYPLGLSYSETSGNMSDEVLTTLGDWDAVVVVSATVIQGMSGGPAFGSDGRIVGIIVGLALGGDGQNIGLVVPAAKVCELFPNS